MDGGYPNDREKRSEQKLGPFPIRRNDSGFFSPSPLTPHQGESRLPGSAATATNSSQRTTAELRGRTTVGGLGAATGANMARPPLQNHTENTPPHPPIEEPLLFAFTCRQHHGDQQWLSCQHPQCNFIRQQWHHWSTDHFRNTCRACTHFQQTIFFHERECSDPNCVVLFCTNARRRMEQNRQPTPATKTSRQLGRSHSFTTPSSNPSSRPPHVDAPSTGMRPRVGSTGAQSTQQSSASSSKTFYNSTSYMEAVSGYTRAGIGYFPPPELALSLGARAEEIVSKLEQEEPFDEDYHTPESSIHASRPTTLAPQLSVGGIPQVSAIVAQERELVASVAPVGVLSPIAEQPGSENTPSPTTSPHSTSLAPLPPRSSGEEALPSERVVHGYREAAEIDMRRYPLQEPVTQFQQAYLSPGDDGYYFEHRDYFLHDVKPLGEGGFGTCVPGQDLNTKLVFALKRNRTDEHDKIESIRRESLLLSKLHCHDHVIRLLGAVIDEDGGTSPPRVCKMIMEFAENGNLAEMLKDEEDSPCPLPVDQSLYYLHQILSGVYHLHSSSVLHLDIKALNVLVFHNGRTVKLADFGSAVHISEVPTFGIAELKGCTPHFIAPEVARQMQPSFSADIWSVMCVFIEMLTAKLPWCYVEQRMEFSHMMYLVGNYTDGKIEELVPISQLQLDEDVADLFYQVFRGEPKERPTALHLLSLPRLVDACEYEKYFDIEYESEEEEEEQVEDEEESFQTAPTSLPILPPPLEVSPQQASSEFAAKSKRSSTDSGVGSSVNTPASAEPYSRQFSQEMKSLLRSQQESIMELDMEGSSVMPPGRTLSCPGPRPTQSIQDYQPGLNPTILAHQFQHHNQQQQKQQQRQWEQSFSTYDWQSSNESSSGFHSLPPSISDSEVRTPDHPTVCELFRSLSLGSRSVGSRPHALAQLTRQQNVVARHPSSIMHSMSAPMMGVGRRRSLGHSLETDSGIFPQQGRLRRTSSEVYVDRGPEIDTPEEKKGETKLGDVTSFTLLSLSSNPPASLVFSEGAISQDSTLTSQSHSFPSSSYTSSSYTSATSSGAGETLSSHGDREGEGEGRGERQGPTAASPEETESRGKREEGKTMFQNII